MGNVNEVQACVVELVAATAAAVLKLDEKLEHIADYYGQRLVDHNKLILDVSDKFDAAIECLGSDMARIAQCGGDLRERQNKFDVRVTNLRTMFEKAGYKEDYIAEVNKLKREVAQHIAFRDESGMYKRMEALEKMIARVANESATRNEYNAQSAANDIMYERLRALENKAKTTVKSFGEQMNENINNAFPPIPPLPQHPRFRMTHPAAEFDCGSTVGYAHWIRIHEMQGKRLEECCCIARGWWLDERDKYGISSQVSEHNESLRVANLWRDYLKARMQTSASPNPLGAPPIFT